MKKIEPIKNSVSQINFGIETILISVFCALGVNLIASGIVIHNPSYSIWLILCGFSVCLVTLFSCLFRRLKAVEKDTSITGFILYNAEKKTIVCVPGYEFSVRMSNYINYCNDESIMKIWNDNPVEYYKFHVDGTGIHNERVNSKSNKLLCELLEYCILHELTNSVSSHFGSLDEKETILISRQNIPQSLLENRFLSWLSAGKVNPLTADFIKGKPESGRGCLLIEDRTEEGKGIRVIAETWMGNQTNMFELFEMILPKKATIKGGNRALSLEHPLFSFKIEYDISGSTASLPPNFLQWYMGSNEVSCYRPYQFNINTHLSFRFKALFTLQWKKYYSWIDSFLNRLYEYASEDFFFETIGWNTANTVVECLKKQFTECFNQGDTL